MANRQYNENELRFLAREIADYFINQTKDKGLVDLDELVDYMRKNYGVPEDITTGVIIMTLQSLPIHMVNLNDTI